MRSSAGLLREHQPRQVVGLRVLLPVDEVLRRRHAQRIGEDASAQCGAGPQAHDLGTQAHAPVVAVVRDVIERDVNRHRGIIRSARNKSRAPICIRCSRATCGQLRCSLARARGRWYVRTIERTLTMSTDWTTYPSAGLHDELIGPAGGARAAGRVLLRYLSELGDEIGVRQQAAELAIKAMGITFTVYHEQDGSIDRAWPLDIIPRTISRREWLRIETRAQAARRRAQPVHRRRVPPPAHRRATACSRRRSLPSSRNFRPTCVGIDPPLGLLGAHLRHRSGARQATARSTCSKTICGCPPACRT